MSTDRAVILRSLDEPAAFGRLFERHARPIHRFIARRTDEQVAEEVVAETFLRAFERRDRFAPTHDSALPWLFGIAVNVLRHRRIPDLPLLPVDEERADEADAIDAAGRRVDAQRRLGPVIAAVRRMPPKSRDVVLLHVWAGLSYEDVGEALQIPVGTVRSRLNRARAALRALPEPNPRTDGEPDGRDAVAVYLP